MKAVPVVVKNKEVVQCESEEATHVVLKMPSDNRIMTLPVMIGGTRKGTSNWTWNGDTEKPTLKPSVLTKRDWKGFVCHSWINDGMVQFLSDSTHDLAGQTVELLDVEGYTP